MINKLRTFRACYLTIFCFFTSLVFAQNTEISGTVTDNAGEPIYGVNVIVKGTAIGAVTDFDGNYTISIPAVDEKTTLSFIFIGFKTVNQVVNGRSTINVSLEEDVALLDEIVVVGYGTQIEKKVTGAIQSISASSFEESPAAQLTQKLQGRLAGVQINQSTGAPGEALKVRIRGQISLSAGSDPLYVIDGQPITGGINTINPNEIETLTVLKDAASTALYGSRATNGVVLITTKRGKAPGTSVNVNLYRGIQQLPYNLEQPLLNATEWVQMRKEAFEDQGLPVPDVFQNPSQYGEGTNWLREITRDAPMTDLSVTFSSNTSSSRATAVLGYFSQEGTVINTGLERFSLRINSDYTVSDWLEVGVNAAPSFTVSNLVPTSGNFWQGNIIYNAMLTPPIFSPYQDKDGDGEIDRVLDPTRTYTAWPWPNYYYNLTNRQQETQTFRMLSNAYASANIAPNLTFKSSASVDLGMVNNSNFIPSDVAPNPWQSVPRNSSMTIEKNNYQSWLAESLLTYDNSFGDHNLNILAGYSVQKYREEGLLASAQAHADDRITTLQSATVPGVPSNTIGEWSLTSYLSKLTYDYQGKYLFSAAIRRDGSSRFGSENRWGNFPSLSAGWILSEDFDLGPVSFAKIRSSWGITGNNAIGNYTQYGAVDIGQSTVFGSTIVPGAAATTIANNTLGWETSSQFDLGVDLTLFNDRVSFTYDYYNKVSSDLLWSLAVPPASGFSSFTGNVGEIKFWGHEFMLNAKGNIGALEYDLGGNISFNQNEVLKLDDTVPFIINNQTITLVGQPVAQFYGLNHTGVYVNDSDFANSPVANISQVGGPKYEDVNGDGVITWDGNSGAPGSDDSTVIGNPIPDFIYGLTANFRYNNFDLSIVGSGSHGNDIFRRSLQGLVNHGDGLMNVLAELKDRWTPSDPGSGNWGKNYGSTAPQDRDWISSNFIYDGSFFTIKNITLGYNFPSESLKGIRSLRLYSSINQAFVFTDYPGSNPEVGGTDTFNQGQDFATYPVPRTITFGINIGVK